MKLQGFAAELLRFPSFMLAAENAKRERVAREAREARREEEEDEEREEEEEEGRVTVYKGAGDGEEQEEDNEEEEKSPNMPSQATLESPKPLAKYNSESDSEREPCYCECCEAEDAWTGEWRGSRKCLYGWENVCFEHAGASPVQRYRGSTKRSWE